MDISGYIERTEGLKPLVPYQFTGMELNLVGDTVLDAGSYRVAKFTTNGHRLEINTRAIQGCTIDGEKDPANWGSNIIVNVPLIGDHATFKLQKYGQHPAVRTLKEKLKSHADGEGGGRGFWIGMRRVIDIIHDLPAVDRTFTNVRDEYAVRHPNAGIYFAVLVDTAQQYTNLTWAQFVAWVVNLGRETSKGEHTHLVEEIE